MGCAVQVVVGVHLISLVFSSSERFKKLPEVGTNIDIVSENKLITGFKLYVVEEWYVSV